MRALPTGGLARVLAIWHRVECWVAVAAFALIAALLILDVLGRELLGPVMLKFGAGGATGVPGAQKMAIFALVVGSFAGVGIATATASHLVPRVAFTWVPESWVPVVGRVGDLVTMVVMLGVAWYGVEFAWGSKAIGLRAPVLDWQVWPFQLAIPAGFASAALRYLCYAWRPDLKPKPPEFQE